MDIVLVGFIGSFIFGGWRNGFLRSLLGLVFTIVAMVLGASFRYPVGVVAKQFFPTIPADYASLVGYVIAFQVILALLHLVSGFVLGRTAPRGMAREMDAALGAVFGALEAILILSAVIVIVDAYFGTNSTFGTAVAPGLLKEFTAAFNASETVKILSGTTVPVVLAILTPILPSDVTKLLPGGLPNRLPFPTSIP